MLKRLGRSSVVQRAAGSLLAAYLKFVYRTSRYISEPADPYTLVVDHPAFIITFWHGQHFMVPFVRRPGHDIRVLISRHRDGEINAIAARKLGLGVIRGSGDHRGRGTMKGGTTGFMAMLAALREGATVSMTADVPKVGRVAGLGIVQLARLSGKVLVPVCFTTRPRIDLDSWDRATVPLPFGRCVFVAGEPISVPEDADADLLADKRREVEDRLNAVTARARALADGKAA